MSKSIKERIALAIVEEINVTNLIAQNEPEIYVPKFIENLATRLDAMFADEIAFRRK